MSGRVRRFFAAIHVADEVKAQQPEMAESLAREGVERALSNLRGPRGGHYEPVGEIEFLGFAQMDDDFIRNLWSYGGRRYGRYVRPKR